MGLFGKIKNILFEEEEFEEYEEENVRKPKEIKEEKPIKKLVDSEPYVPTFRRPIEPEVKEEIKPTITNVVKREENSPFVSFDEDEFEKVKVKTTKTTSNISIERKPDGAKKINYNKYEIKEETTKTPFKPSPVISPVYGILDKTYKKDDLLPKKKSVRTNQVVNVDTVRNKAFGTLEDEIEDNLGVKIDYYDEVPLESEPIEDIINDSLKEEETIEEKPKDETFSIEDALDSDSIEEDVEEQEVLDEEESKSNLENSSAIEILDEIEKELDNIKEKNDENSDSLENDLFELIDSMYDQRKDGEQ